MADLEKLNEMIQAASEQVTDCEVELARAKTRRDTLIEARDLIVTQETAPKEDPLKDCLRKLRAWKPPATTIMFDYIADTVLDEQYNARTVRAALGRMVKAGELRINGDGYCAPETFA